MPLSSSPPGAKKKTSRAASSNKKKTLASGAVVSHPTVASLNNSSQLTTEQWYRSATTTRTYAGYVKAGKKWLTEWANESRQTMGGEDSAGISEECSVFLDAFDCIGEHTPTALRMLTTFKCDHEEKKFATAEGLRSAFKSYFER